MLTNVTFMRTWGSKDRFAPGHNIKAQFVYTYPGGLRYHTAYITPESATLMSRRLAKLGYGQNVTYHSSGKGDIVVTFNREYAPRVVIAYSGDHQDVYTLEAPDGVDVSYIYQD